MFCDKIRVSNKVATYLTKINSFTGIFQTFDQNLTLEIQPFPLQQRIYKSQTFSQSQKLSAAF